MNRQVIGILHPGSMGAAVAACAAGNAAAVLWASARRSRETLARAERFGLERVPTVRELLDRSDIVISLCPPAAAEDVAGDVAEADFAGLYVEANAISPERSLRIAELLGTAAIVVDGAVIGSPPVGGKTPMSIPSNCGDLLSGQLQGGVGPVVVLVVDRTLISTHAV
ncbi:NAD(P)-binding domain-containing protein [Actinacidiphila glaucinigra]|uniref:NAD(P)-binding domain-containing protein n=1 Tax=Actinacidiphila glaucinigra TaxID=235986 RepID=UPI0035E2F738